MRFHASHSKIVEAQWNSSSSRAMMKHYFLLMVFPCIAARICFQILPNIADIDIPLRRPSRIWHWNALTGEFEKLNSLTVDSANVATSLCSVNAVSDLRGKTLVAAIDPGLGRYVIKNANNTDVTGFIGDIWTTLEKTLGFTTIYRRVRKRYARTLMNGNTHALLVPMGIYSYPASYFTYSTSFATNSYALFVRSGGKKVTSSWYIDTFNSDLWLMCFAFFIFITCSFIGIYYIKKMIYVNYKELNDELSSPSFNLLYVLSGLCGQGFQQIPGSWSFRLMSLSCLVMGILLSGGFSSTLTSELTNKKNSVPVTNLEDVMIKRTHFLCLRNDTTAYTYFTKADSLDSEIKAAWKGIVNNDCPDMEDEVTLASNLCRPGFIYLEAPDIFLPIYYKVRHQCSIIQLSETYWKRKLAFLHARSSPYQEIINIYLIRMNTAGIFNYLRKKWISMEFYGQSNYYQWNTFQPVEYEHIRLVFYGLFVMIIISVFICILENIWYKIQLKFEKTNSNSILLGTHDNRPFVTKKARHKMSPKFVAVRQRRKINLIWLPGKLSNPEFLQDVTMRVNRW